MKKKLTCDCCGKEIESFTDYTCYICKKTICPECIGHREMWFDDYSEVYCEHCWEIGKPYFNKIELLQEKILILYDEICELETEWRSECINNLK